MSTTPNATRSGVPSFPGGVPDRSRETTAQTLAAVVGAGLFFLAVVALLAAPDLVAAAALGALAAAAVAYGRR